MVWGRHSQHYFGAGGDSFFFCGGGGSVGLHHSFDMAEISSYDHTPQHLHRDAPPSTMPEGTLIVYCLIMLTHNHEAEDGSHFLFVPSSSSGFPDPWVERAVPFNRGTAFFLMPLIFTGGRAFQRPCPLV